MPNIILQGFGSDPRIVTQGYSSAGSISVPGWPTMRMITRPRRKSEPVDLRRVLQGRVLHRSRVEAVAAAVVASENTLLNGLVSAWGLNEASGVRYDAYGGNHLTAYNAPVSASGVVDQAADFVYASQQYLGVASNSTLQLGDVSFAVTAWVRLNEKTLPHILVSKDGPSSGQREFSLYFDAVENAFCGLVFRPTDSSVAVSAANFGSPSVGAWCFLYFYHDADANVIGISVNNGTANTQATGGALQSASNGAFQIGGSAKFPTLYQQDGRIDAVTFHKGRVLTADEVSSIYNAGSGKEYPF